MKVKSINKYYLIGIIPLLLLNMVLGLILTYETKWIFYSILAISLAIIYKIFMKFSCLPKRATEYKDFRPLDLKIPIPYDVELYISSDLDKYDFLNRVVEIISPLHQQKGEKLRVVISEKFLKTYRKRFMEIAVCREIEKFRTKSTLKIVLALIIPILTVTAIVMYGCIIEINILKHFSLFVGYFLLPFFTVVLILTYLWFWNKYMSREEMRLDRFLMSHFKTSDIEEYIITMEKIEGGEEAPKNKEFNEFYAKKRLEKLKEKH